MQGVQGDLRLHEGNRPQPGAQRPDGPLIQGVWGLSLTGVVQHPPLPLQEQAPQALARALGPRSTRPAVLSGAGRQPLVAARRSQRTMHCARDLRWSLQGDRAYSAPPAPSPLPPSGPQGLLALMRAVLLSGPSQSGSALKKDSLESNICQAILPPLQDPVRYQHNTADSKRAGLQDLLQVTPRQSSNSRPWTHQELALVSRCSSTAHRSHRPR